MKEKRDKKPNFRKDLNARVLDKLTEGGKVKNAVGLAGEVKELAAVTNILLFSKLNDASIVTLF